MKVTVKEKSIDKEYPWIGISNQGNIILFTKSGTGISLSSAYADGSYTEGWQENLFKPFHGEITLSNS
jgi:hypothetical protein